MNRFIFIRGIGFLFYNNLRMVSHKLFVVERNMSNDTKAIGYNAEFKNIAEVSIDVKLLDFGIGTSMGRHFSIGSLVGIIVFIKALSLSISL